MGLDEYSVGKAAGKGKFSTVFRAKRLCDNQTVALKKIDVDVMSQEDLDACLREVKMLDTVCDHQNIISYLDSFLEDQSLYIVLEWAHAGDLKRQIRKAQEKGARFDEILVWKIFTQIADALRHMHSKRTMHRDLKPANIFLSSDGTVKVGDLGLGRFLSEQTLEAFTKVGTPLYMSPELLAGKKGAGYGFSSDVYSLGCILYELVKLRAPFKEKGMKFNILCERVLVGDYEPLPDVFSDELRDLVDQMLNVNPDARPSLDEIVRISKDMRSRLADSKQRGGSSSAGGKTERKSSGSDGSKRK